MSSYLVTGGAGFIGSHLVEELVRRGQAVRVVDNLATGQRRNLAHVDGVEFVESDLADLAVAQGAVRDIEYVVHQAAIPSVQRSVLDPIASHRANVDATLNLLIAARDAGVRRVVYAGSSSAYGNSPSLPKHEKTSAAPLSPYALQKLVGEHYARLFSELYGLDTVSLRYFNVFGPRQDPSLPYAGVISQFVSAVIAERRPTIYGDGEQTRDYTYVANVVDGTLKTCAAPGVSGRIINIACGGKFSLKQLLVTLGELTGKTVEPIYDDPRPGDVRHSQADISLARTLLGYQPVMSFREGLRRTVEWYRAERAAGSSGRLGALSSTSK